MLQALGASRGAIQSPRRALDDGAPRRYLLSRRGNSFWVRVSSSTDWARSWYFVLFRVKHSLHGIRQNNNESRSCKPKHFVLRMKCSHRTDPNAFVPLGSPRRGFRWLYQIFSFGIAAQGLPV